MTKTKLFCLPYAGGSANIYMSWKRIIDNDIEVCPVELKGRGRRYDEKLYDDLEEATEDIYKYIKDQINGSQDFALYGHSMGSILVYELAHKLKERLGLTPKHIFFSGHGAPDVVDKGKKLHLLGDAEFKHELLELGGTPKQVLEEKELLELFLPLLRSDFKIIENYSYLKKNTKLDCDFTVLNGKKDDLTISDITKWRSHTDKHCKIVMFDGGHFFINDSKYEIVKIINSTLKN